MVETPLVNTVPRLLAIGDIHGCHRQLQELISQVRPTENDQLIFLGDYIDRGPDSAGVIDYLLALQARFPRSVFLRGNHDQMLLDVLEGGDPTMFLLNGGGKTIASYLSLSVWPPPAKHREFFEGLSTLYQTEAFIFVHAGLRPGLTLEEQTAADLLWIRQDFLANSDRWGKIVVFGHTPRAAPLLDEHRIGLDTGCVYGGHLTCCDVLTRRCWQVLGQKAGTEDWA